MIGTAGITVASFFIYFGLLIYSSWPISDLSIYKASLFGDSFGVFASLFSGLAFLGALYTIYLQGQELKLQREEMSKNVATQIRQLHHNLITMAMDDESLESVWEEKKPLTHEPLFKQKAYVNLILSHWEMQYSHGMITDKQLDIALSKYMSFPYFRNFWEKAEAHRSDMQKASSYNNATKFHVRVNEAYNKASISIAENIDS